MLKLLSICLFLPFGLLAQSFTPCFTANSTKGCVPFTIKLTNCSGAAPNLVLYDFGEGAKPTDQYTFTKAGKYFITQYINSGTGGVKSDGKFEVEVTDSFNPTFTVQICANKQAVVTVTDTRSSRFLVEYGDNTKDTVANNKPKIHTYTDISPKTITVSAILDKDICGQKTATIQPFDSLPQPQITKLITFKNNIQLNYQISSVLPYQLIEKVSDGKENRYNLDVQGVFSANKDFNSKYYIYQILASNPCNSQSVVSQSINTVSLNVATTVGRNILTWTDCPLPNFAEYIVYRDNKEIARINSAVRNIYDDQSVKCSQKYCYKVATVYRNSAIISESSEECITTSSFSLPPPIPFIASTVNEKDKHINLSWGLPNNITIQKMILHKSVNGNTPLLIDIPKSTSYIDQEVNIYNRTYCYQVTYIDECGNSSQLSAKTCPILLSLSKNLYTINLTWNNNDDTKFIYYIEKLDENGTIINTSAPLNGNSFSDERLALQNQNNRYRIRAEGIYRKVTSYSNEVSFIQDARLICPNAFSPNNDGLNDTFVLDGVFVKDFKMTIFDRWGSAIHLSNDLKQAWDGRFEGRKVPVGDYVYYIEFTDQIGNKLQQNGIVTVVY